MYNTPQQTEKSLLLTRQAVGTLHRVMEMTGDNEYCPKIIQQLDAAIGLLKSAKKELLTGHLEHCLEDKLKTDKAGTVKELVEIFKLNN